ncbi:MAG: hypothetical protein WBH14_07750 [Albidovulum sp.]
MKNPIVCASVLFLLSGCDLWEALLDGFARLKAQPHFAYVVPVLPDGGAPGDVTPEISVATVSAPGEAYVFQSIRPFPGLYSEARTIVWDGTGTRLAAEVREVFFGGFDDWVFIYDRDLVLEYSGSDDVIGGAMRSACAPFDAPQVQDAVDLLISEGSVPTGSIARYQPGSGIIQGATFVGWLSATEFAVTLYHEPEAFAVAPDGTVYDISVIIGSNTLGEFLTPAATFTRNGTAWELDSCSEPVPAIPARPVSAPAITLGPLGDVLADGSTLSDQNAQALTGAVLVDGSF